MQDLTIEEALKITGFSLCEFKADGKDECSTCDKPIKKGNNVYYERTCYEVDEGEYHCEDCVKKKPEEWKDFGAGLMELHKESNGA